jgi:hypothetical protein
VKQNQRSVFSRIFHIVFQYGFAFNIRYCGNNDITWLPENAWDQNLEKDCCGLLKKITLLIKRLNFKRKQMI